MNRVSPWFRQAKTSSTMRVCSKLIEISGVLKLYPLPNLCNASTTSTSSPMMNKTRGNLRRERLMTNSTKTAWRHPRTVIPLIAPQVSSISYFPSWGFNDSTLRLHLWFSLAWLFTPLCQRRRLIRPPRERYIAGFRPYSDSGNIKREDHLGYCKRTEMS